eukprot:g392.t1
MNLSQDSSSSTLFELQKELEAAREKSKLDALVIQEKESEAQCAVAWAQTASETVTALETQLDEVENELEETQRELAKYKSSTTPPPKSKEDAIRSIVQQLQESQTREAEMFQQAEDMQRTLLEVQEQLAERIASCAQNEDQIKTLTENLNAALQRETNLVSQCQNTTSLWDTYNQVRSDMDRTLSSHLTAAGLKKQNGSMDKLSSVETFRLEEEVHELEMELARAENSLIEERNKRVKLEEENATLHKHILKLQQGQRFREHSK